MVLADGREWADEVAARALLIRRPEFLLGDAELMSSLGVRPNAANVVDFGPAALSRVAKAHKNETRVRQRLEAVARANFDAQSHTHEAAVELIAAKSHGDLVRRLGRVARERLGLRTAVLALEGPERIPPGWKALAPGQCDLLLGPDRPARLGHSPTAVGLFGEMAADIGSAALIRLAVFSPSRQGVLALGAGEADTFAPDMGCELIGFLARVVERTAERWPSP
ncbi:MAG: DUF484 family protein [Caulobacteraceae bacterium]